MFWGIGKTLIFQRLVELLLLGPSVLPFLLLCFLSLSSKGLLTMQDVSTNKLKVWFETAKMKARQNFICYMTLPLFTLA